jgi:hypothetical protein
MTKKKSKTIVKPVCLDEETINLFTVLGNGNLSRGAREAGRIVKNLNSLALVNKPRTKS